MKLNSIVKSHRIIGTDAVRFFVGTVSVPNIPKLSEQTLEELAKLALKQVDSGNYQNTFSLTLTNGDSVRVGSGNFYQSHTFDPAKKITRVETNILDEWAIVSINFYSGEELLASLIKKNFIRYG